MNLVDEQIRLSAGDLSHHIACKHLTTLDLAGAHGLLAIPPAKDPALIVLQQRGLELEQQYLAKFRDEGLNISEPVEDDPVAGIKRTITAMSNGVDIIYQAPLKMDQWYGRADFLRKVAAPSNLGNWSYEVIDSKLAKQTKAGTIVQLCLYSEMVAAVQELMPEYMHVITPGDENQQYTYRLDDFLAYYRYIKKRLVNSVAGFTGLDSTYPVPCSFCDICNWREHCNAHLRSDDHLTFVAGLSNTHVTELARQQIKTMQALSELATPLPFRPQRGAIETFERLREQARIQVQARSTKKPVYELMQIEEGRGFFKLPTPSPGDIFFDFEGDPFVGNTGMEYLFGWIPADAPDTYQKLWALTQAEEKQAFESFVNTVMERWGRYPDMHIYHFTAYEPSALKRLMGKYATKETEIDRMLRAGLFIDLHTVTRQAILAGIETYSLKELEKFHGFEREFELREAAAQLRVVERHIELKQSGILEQKTLHGVEKYNQEDCLSTMQLRNWLEKLRAEMEKKGAVISRPEHGDGSPGESLTEYQQRIAVLIEQLTNGLPVDRDERNAQQQARWLLANMLDWYRREKKATWWEFFRLRELSPTEILEEKAGVGGLEFNGNSVLEKKSVIDEYEFPPQDYDIREGDDLYNVGDGMKIGTVLAIDNNTSKIRIKKGPKTKDIHPIAVFTITDIPNEVKEQAIERICRWVVNNDVDAPGDFRAGRDLLINHPPRITGQLPAQVDAQKKAVEWVMQLDQSVLPIQGPPGAGKSHTAAEMILALIRAGKKVGITALSHQVIVNLMVKVVEASQRSGVAVNAMRKVSNLSDNPNTAIAEEKKNDAVEAAIRSGQINLLGGTTWLWAREDMAASVDFLFVDEAGQLSLIDTVAVSQSATSMVLLGDPQQLQQPQQGSHPDGTEVSALQHILEEHKTIPKDRGVFLDTTWRMHPEICSFISELFYENRLRARPELSNQGLDGNEEFRGSGLYYRPVTHEGNQSSSQEEAEYVKNLIVKLTNGAVLYTDKDNLQRVLTADDIKVITPYNAQVNLLSALLPATIQIGTVDKFQGQEAPVIIFSMATSSPSDAPRGMEFLYSGNRFNVAVSRARVAFILVASPLLFEPDCKNVEQMKLANAFSRYLEVAK